MLISRLGLYLQGAPGYCAFAKKDNEVSNLLRAYNKTYGLLHELETDSNFLNQVCIPKLNDKQLVTLKLAVEGLGIDSESVFI